MEYLKDLNLPTMKEGAVEEVGSLEGSVPESQPSIHRKEKEGELRLKLV